MDNQNKNTPRFRPNAGLKLMGQGREVLRYYHAHRAPVDGVDRTVVRFHGRRPPNGPFPAEPKVEAFLTDLAVHGNAAAATQSLAMNALVFLYTRLLHQALPGRINAVRRQEAQHPRGHDPRNSRRGHLAAIRHRPTGCHTALRQRLAYHGSRPVQGRGSVHVSSGHRSVTLLFITARPSAHRCSAVQSRSGYAASCGESIIHNPCRAGKRQVVDAQHRVDPLNVVIDHDV
jgi:Phage integrase, N-terminal SAM-like domain